MKRYKNVGESKIDVGHERSYGPGEEFSAAIDEDHEGFLIQIGALKVLNTSGKADGKDKK
jgi:hypothetical protein